MDFVVVPTHHVVEGFHAVDHSFSGELHSYAALRLTGAISKNARKLSELQA
jgi:hypothetical protein